MTLTATLFFVSMSGIVLALMGGLAHGILVLEPTRDERDLRLPLEKLIDQEKVRRLLGP